MHTLGVPLHLRARTGVEPSHSIGLPAWPGTSTLAVVASEPGAALSDPGAASLASPAPRLTTPASSDVARWFVLYVRSRQEKILSDDLVAMGVGHFLPLVHHSKFYGKRKVSVELPLFPGYLFLRGSVDELHRADRTKRVARIITVSDQQRLDWELRNIHLALTRDARLEPYPHFVAGARVRVRSGVFEGVEGVVEHRSKGDRLFLQVELLGRATSVEIDGAQLEPLD